MAKDAGITQQTQVEIVEIKMVSKITAKELGNPKKVLAMDGDDAKHILGNIFGIATEVKRKDIVDAGGTTSTFWPLIGQFVGVLPDQSQVRSGVLYLPTGIHESYKAAVENMQEGDTLRFALRLQTVKASSPAGYAYQAVDLMPPKTVDLLSEFKLAAESDGSQKLLKK
jgi:hypothetical protein